MSAEKCWSFLDRGSPPSPTRGEGGGYLLPFFREKSLFHMLSCLSGLRGSCGRWWVSGASSRGKSGQPGPARALPPPRCGSGAAAGACQLLLASGSGGGGRRGPVAVTKGQRAGASAGLFLSLGRRPPVGPRGRKLGSDSASGARAGCLGVPASLFVVVVVFQVPFLSLPREGRGGRPNTHFYGEHQAASECCSPECFHSALVRRARRGFCRGSSASLLAGSRV